MADNEEMKTEYDMFADIWKLLKRFYHPIENQIFWQDLISASHELEIRYNSPLCNDLLVAVILELERKHNHLFGDDL